MFLPLPSQVSQSGSCSHSGMRVRTPKFLPCRDHRVQILPHLFWSRDPNPGLCSSSPTQRAVEIQGKSVSLVLKLSWLVLNPWYPLGKAQEMGYSGCLFCSRNLLFLSQGFIWLLMSGKGERGKGGIPVISAIPRCSQRWLYLETFRLLLVNTELKLQTAAICYFSFFGEKVILAVQPCQD